MPHSFPPRRSSDLEVAPPRRTRPDHVVAAVLLAERGNVKRRRQARILDLPVEERLARAVREQLEQRPNLHPRPRCRQRQHPELRRLRIRSEEHTSELQSLMRISYAVFCLKKQTSQHTHLKLNISRH